jgi:hypothetical protein
MLPMPVSDRVDGLQTYVCGVCCFLVCALILFTLIGLPEICDPRYALLCALGAGTAIAGAICVVVFVSTRMYYQQFIEYDPEADEKCPKEEQESLI